MKEARTVMLDPVGLRSLVTSSFADSDLVHPLGRFAIRDIISRANDMEPAPGQARALPEQVIAGRRGTVLIEYTAGPGGLPAGSRLAMLLPEFWGGRIHERDMSVFVLPKAKGAYPGYITGHITAHTSRADAPVEGTVTCSGSVHTAVELTVMGEGLGEGDTVSFVIGDNWGHLPMGMELAGTYFFNLLVDVGGAGEYRRVGPYPAVTVSGDTAARLRVTAPAIWPAGKPFALKITPMDQYMNWADGYKGAFDLYVQGEKEPLLRDVEYTPLPGRAMMVVEGLPAQPGGIRRFVAVDRHRGIGGASNPMAVGGWAGENALWFGDIHCHTGISDGIGLCEDAYRHSRDVLHHDLGALSDHFEPGQPTLYYRQDEKWPRTVAACRKFYEPGRYATLLGYEWAVSEAHKNVYYRDDLGDVYSGRHPETDSLAKMSQYMGRFECVVIPHHPKFLNPVTWDPSTRNPDQEKLVEIYSAWGSSEEGSDSAVRAALNRGMRFGFTGGTDNHIGRMGLGNWVNYGSGILGAFAPELTREAVYDALKGKRCYGTTGARMLVDFTVGGAFMGGEIALPADTARHVEARVAGEGDLLSLEIIKNGEVVCTQPCDGPDAALSWTDPAPAGATDYYYLRATQQDGHVAWASPVFVDRA